MSDEMGLLEAKDLANRIMVQLTTTSPELPALTPGERKALTDSLVIANARISELEPSDSYVVGEREMVTPEAMIEAIGEIDPETTARIRESMAEVEAMESAEARRLAAQQEYVDREMRASRLRSGVATIGEIEELRSALVDMPAGPTRDALQRRIQIESDRQSDAEQAKRSDESGND